MKNTTLETLIPTIDAIEAKVIPKPVEHLISEARQFHTILETEKPLFVARGLSEEFLSLGFGIAVVLQDREEKWLARRFDEPEVVDLWKKKVVEGYEVRGQLLADLDLALMDNTKAQRSIEKVKEGSGTADMLLDIGKLVEIGQTYPDDIVSGGLSLEYLANAEAKGHELTKLYNSSEVAQGEATELKDARDKAKVFTAGYLSLIRKYADVIYRNDPDKRDLFVSEYDARRAKKKTSSDEESELTA